MEIDRRKTTVAEVVKNARITAAAVAVVPPVEAKPSEGKGGVVLKGTKIVNEEHGVIVGIGSLADAIDLDRDSVPADLMVKAAHDFCGRDKRTFKANHSEKIDGKLAESWTGVPVLDQAVDGVTRTDEHGLHRLKAGQHIPEDRTVVATAFKADETDAVAWFVGIKPSDPALVEAAKKGDVAGLSWGGPADREAANA
jgi:hypothetical protein